MAKTLISAKEKKLILKNFASLSTLQSINYLLPIVILPYIIRIIGLEKFGLIAFAQAFIQYFMILTDYGFNLSATRKISLCEKNKKKVCSIFSSVITAKIFLSLVSFAILLTIISFVPKFKKDWLLYIYSFGAVIGNTLFPVWFFQGKEKMAYISRINIACGITYVIFIFLFIKTPIDYLYIPLFNSLSLLIAGISGLYVAFTRFGLEYISQTYTDIQKELKAGWDIFISIIAVNAYTTTRVFAIGLFTNNILTGYYSIAERIAGFIQTFLLEPFSQAIYPRLNKIFIKNKQRALKLMRKIQKNTMIGYLLTLPLVFLAADFIINIFCGTPYPQAAKVLRLLLIGVFFIGANAFRVQFLLICGRTDIYSKLHITAALFGLPLIFILIHYFSYLGAAVATVIIEAGVITTTFYIARKYVIPSLTPR